MRRLSKEELEAQRKLGELREKRQKQEKWTIIRLVAVLVVLIALGTWYGLRNRPPRVTEITPASALDNTFRPVEAVTSYSPQDTFFISFHLAGYRQPMTLTARWRYDGQIIRETDLSTDMIGDGYAGFVLMNDNPPWPTGRYTVEILYYGDVLGSAEWQVVDGG